MELFYNESVISTSDDRSLTLTNMRIRHVHNDSGCSILLENIQSVSFEYKSYPAMLITGILLCLCGLFTISDSSDIAASGIVIGIILILGFLFTRRHYLSIYSGGGSPIQLLVKGQSTAQLTKFIDLTEETICQRKREIMAYSQAK